MSKFLDQLWISHLPKNEKDAVCMFVTFTDEGFGIFEESSEYSGKFDFFEFQEGKEASILGKILQTEKNFLIKGQVRECNTPDFDYELIVTGDIPQGPSKYYTMKDWNVDRNSNTEEMMHKLIKKINI